MNGGFPPIKYIVASSITSITNKDKEQSKERYFAPIPNKHLDIKKILINSINSKITSNKNNTINIIDIL